MQEGLVIPCYNEAARLKTDLIERLLQMEPNLQLLFVDDGSKDATADLLSRLAEKHPRIQIKILKVNQGKAEAVRQGMLDLIGKGFDWVGYADADFATPIGEISRLWQISRTGEAKVILGSRVRLLGREINRNLLRHYLGRVFATFSSLILRLPVYDTQCGAKLFLSTPALRQSLAQPFKTRWIFDVELLGRLLCAMENRTNKDFIEVPLMEWRDVGGSKLKSGSMLRAVLDLMIVAWEIRGRRKKSAKSLSAPTQT
jgi:dolichyl-phosphate beta-glucosyltransferase